MHGRRPQALSLCRAAEGAGKYACDGAIPWRLAGVVAGVMQARPFCVRVWAPMWICIAPWRIGNPHRVLTFPVAFAQGHDAHEARRCGAGKPPVPSGRAWSAEIRRRPTPPGQASKDRTHLAGHSHSHAEQDLGDLAELTAAAFASTCAGHGQIDAVLPDWQQTPLCMLPTDGGHSAHGWALHAVQAYL